MTDLLNRLRTAAAGNDGAIAEYCDEAAQEIVRLREALEEAGDWKVRADAEEAAAGHLQARVAELEKAGEAVVKKFDQRCSSEKLGLILEEVSDMRAVLAAESATPAPTPWQDIESAPKDGRPILIWQPDRAGEDFCGADDRGYAIGYWRTFEVSGGWGNRNNCDVHPTHWMPLPPAPAEGK